jgi:mono/diheme cytochrome c family protein
VLADAPRRDDEPARASSSGLRRFFRMLAGVLRHNTGEEQVTIGHGGTRPTHAIWAALVMILAVAGCAREEEPAPPPAAPPPAATPPPAPPAAAAAAIRDSADPLAHGRYLVETVAGCGNCHTPRLPDGTPDNSKNLAGAFVIEEPVFKAYARNITPDMETGIGSWTEDQIVDAIRNARRPDGTFMGPPMSFGWYKNMSDTDVRAIAKYIKTVPAVRNEVPESTFSMGPNGPPQNIFGPIVTTVPDVPKTDIVKYGEYLAGPVGHCMDCHTTYVMGQIDMAQLGRGGNVYSRPFIYDWAAVSANITSHPEAGLGAWTDDEIKRAITKGISRNGRELLPFMPYWLYDKMEASDLDAIVAYLRSLPPLGAAAPAVPE